ncbi:MAG TPA: DNA replication and repair protein RecF [Ignavibacteriales bacterium]|nr:DNA replication and repair protein RecF [Ignavibacteriales bacterium]
MVLNNLILKNFRLHINTELKPAERVNLIVGENAQGKTSLLEAIYLICTTKSYLTNYLSEIVNYNSLNFEVEANLTTLTNNKLRIFFDKQENKKYIFRDDKNIKNPMEYIGFFPVILLTPDDHEITKGTPKNRRKFVDGFLSQIKPNYLNNLIDYNNIIKNRSVLLNKYKETREKYIFDELILWTERLANVGEYITQERIEWISSFNKYLEEIYNRIIKKKEQPKIEYKFSFNGKSLKEHLFNNLETEINKAQNLYGPHRDDLLFFINNYELKVYGSQGQHKTFLTSLKFAQYFYYRDLFNKDSIFLMDDVFGELDSTRSQMIAEYLNQIGQAFITITDFSNYKFLRNFTNDAIFQVQNGVVTLK